MPGKLRLEWLIVLGSMMAACAPTAEHAGSGPFSTEQLISSETANGATPMFLVAADGRRVLSWVAADTGATDGVLHFRVVRPRDGDTVRSQLRDPIGSIEPHGESPPQLAATAAGVLYTAYTVGRESSERFPPSALRFARSEDGGRSWSEPVSVNEGETFGSHSFHALLTGDDGTVFVSWLSSIKGASGVWLRASHDGGRSWEPSHPVHADPTCPCCRTGLALARDGTLYLAFRKVFDGDVRDIVVIASRDGGRTWSAPVRPRTDNWVFAGCPHAGPSMKVDSSGVVHIAWWTGKPGGAGVWYAQSSDGGATWTSQPIDTADRAAPAHVQLVVAEGGRVVVTWDDGLGALPRVLVRASSDGGIAFGKILSVTRPSVAATFPVAGIDGDSLVVAWTQTTDSAYRAELTARPDMKMAGARMALPRVGQQEVLAATAALTGLGPAGGH